MVAYCLVWCCKSNTNTEGIRFFRVTEVRKCAWMKALNRDPIEISCQQRICSLHFSPNDFYLKNGKEHLKSTAVPCLNLTPSSSGVQMEVSFNKGNYHVITQSCHKLGVDPLGADPSAPSTSRIEEHRGQYRPATHSFRELGIDPLGADLYTSSTSGIEQNNVDTNPSISVKLDCTQKQPTDKSICSDSSSALNESPYRTEKRKIKETSSDSEGLKGSPKKRRRLLRTMHTYCKSPRKLNRSVVILKKQSAGLRSIIHNEKRKVIRLKKKVSNLYQIVHELKKRCLISSTATEALEKCCTGIPLALMRRMLGNRNKLSRQKFPEDLRRFAVTLQFYSSKAYAYVRKTFNLALPSPSVIRSWMTNVKCDPGFTEQAFAALKLQIDADKEKGLVTVCSLMLDEMAIKKQIDFAAGKVWGYVNCGSNLDDDELPCATEALVLMVVAVNGRWKIPIAYFLICGLNGNEKANIVKQALLKLHELNIVITSVTCDGPSAHFNMAKQLGAKISDVNNIVPYFPHPADESDVFIVFDVCHMLKLLRNAWGTDVILRDGNNNVLNFDYINKLHRIETTEVLRLGTKIKKAHVEWTKQKMKVNLAAQTLSNSVADALEFLRSDIKHPDFKDAGPTIKFIRLIDRVFDLLNSRNPFGRGCKCPLTISNINYWHPIFLQAIDCLKTCKNAQGTSMVETRKKTAFIGLIISIKSVIGIYNKYIVPEDGPLKYLLTYKLSQDHLELFFCSVRSRNGWNNNPTAYQFYNTYRRLLVHHEVRTGNGNCLSQDSTSMLHVTAKNDPTTSIGIDNIADIRKYGLVIDDEDEDMPAIPELSLIAENVVTYISGYVVRMAKKRLKCNTCILALEEVSSVHLDDSCLLLFNRKNRGGLIKPAADVAHICKTAESAIRLILNSGKIPGENNFFNGFVLNLCRKVVMGKQIFKNLHDHVLNSSLDQENHIFSIIKTIISCYCKIRFHSLCKRQSEIERGELVRKKFSRLILLYNQ